MIECLAQCPVLIDGTSSIPVRPRSGIINVYTACVLVIYLQRGRSRNLRHDTGRNQEQRQIDHQMDEDDKGQVAAPEIQAGQCQPKGEDHTEYMADVPGRQVLRNEHEQ